METHFGISAEVYQTKYSPQSWDVTFLKVESFTFLCCGTNIVKF